MATKTTTSTTTRITNTYGETYFVTKSTLREGFSGGYKLKLIDLKQALKEAAKSAAISVPLVPFTHNGQSESYGTPYSARVFVEKKNGRLLSITIGCQRFKGKNAVILMRATRNAKPLARAAAAGV